MMHLICAFGEGFLSLVKNSGKILWFFIRILALGCSGPFYKKQAWSHLFTMGYLSVPLVTLTALFTGMVLAFQSYSAFSRFSTEGALPEIIALSLTRELGPVLTGLMMAGRWGASIAAELATMRVTDQLDALETLSTNPIRYLVVPKILAAIISMPILALMADAIGIAGGYIVSVYHYHLYDHLYIAKTLSILSFNDVYSGLVKSCFFGFIIAFIGCYEGYYATGGAAGVGISTTRSVVRSCMLILLVNYLLTALLFSY